MKKTILCISILFIFQYSDLYSLANLNKNKKEKIINEFFNYMSKKDYKSAIGHLMTESSIYKYLKSKTNKFYIDFYKKIQQNGSFISFKFLGKKMVKSTIWIESYLLIFENLPKRMNFIFYKPKNQWKLIAFNMDDLYFLNMDDYIKLRFNK